MKGIKMLKVERTEASFGDTQMFWFCVLTVDTESHRSHQEGSTAEEVRGVDEWTQTQNLTEKGS